MAIVSVSDNMNSVLFERNDHKTENYNYSRYSITPKPPKKEKEKPAQKIFERHSTFLATMKTTILIGQCFGLNPVLGVSENDASKLRFRFYSARSMLSFFSILGQSWIFFMNASGAFKDNVHWGNKSALIFFGTNCLITIFFVRVAMKWPRLCQRIAKIEATNPNLDRYLVKKCNITCVVILSLAALEHSLSVMVDASVAIDCYPSLDRFKAFALITRNWLWDYFSYDTIVAVLAQIFVMQCTFNWNFADVFVICISFYLTSRVQQVNDRLLSIKGKYLPVSFWRAMREEYTNATNLVKEVDEVVSSVIFISFLNNIFTICTQILHLIDGGIKIVPACGKDPADRPLKGYEQIVYLLYSFTFLIARALAVSLMASRVHSASMIPTYVLHNVPSPSYCLEVNRFLSQVHNGDVALTGLQFFKVKRGIVLTIAGTIVTYELVLLQFTGINPTPATMSA